MANRKSLVLQSQVIALSARGLSGRRIAAELKIDRKTIARILASDGAKRVAAAILHESGMPKDFALEAAPEPGKNPPTAPEHVSPPKDSIRDLALRQHAIIPNGETK